MIQNPPWIDSILTENWSELESTVDPAMLPLTAVKPRGRIRRIQAGAEYGCGTYGCVMATGTPGIVCKVTSDPTEAEFVQLAWERLGREPEDEGGYWPRGVVRYYQIIGLTGSRRNRPTWMLWRDEAWDVGGVWNFQQRRVMGQSTLDHYDQSALGQGIHRLAQFGYYARIVRQRWRTNVNVQAEVIKLWKDGAYYNWAAESFSEDDFAFKAVPKHLRGAQFIAAVLEACEMTLQYWTNEPGLNDVARALDVFLDKGMLLADVHQGNIGRPTSSWRNDKMGDWVITDPGHLVKLW
jgi:hypothetical protein